MISGQWSVMGSQLPVTSYQNLFVVFMGQN